MNQLFSKIMSIYRWPLNTVFCVSVIVILLWTWMFMKFQSFKWWKFFNVVLLLTSIFVILRFTVLGRAITDQHIFIWAIPDSNEFIREMVMNAFLFLPLGSSLSSLIGWWAALAGFCFSCVIEFVQYKYGLGVAQGTDIIMNALGCFIGCMPLGLKKLLGRFNL